MSGAKNMKTTISNEKIEEQIAKVLAQVLPDDDEVSDEALRRLREQMEQFITQLSTASAQRCMQGRNRRIEASHVLDSLQVMGHKDIADILSERGRTTPNQHGWASMASMAGNKRAYSLTVDTDHKKKGSTSMNSDVKR
jgi:hypothetical protein